MAGTGRDLHLTTGRVPWPDVRASDRRRPGDVTVRPPVGLVIGVMRTLARPVRCLTSVAPRSSLEKVELTAHWPERCSDRLGEDPVEAARLRPH
jgi:hypothetical protein